MAPRSAPTARRRLLLVALAACAGGARGQVTERARESLVKAAFLHKFPSFVEWPDGLLSQPQAPIRIGVRGDDLVLADLRDLARDRDRDGRPVQVARLAPGDTGAGFHIVYLRTASAAQLGEWLAAVPEGVLTVSDVEGVVSRASVISFIVEDGRVRFGISTEAAARQRLRLSSRLLALARPS